MARKPGVRSSIERLDGELVEKINGLIRDGYTIREMVDKLKELGVTVSKSAMGRYAKSANESMEKLKEAEATATAWIRAIGTEPTGDIGRLATELLKVVSVDTLMKINESGKEVKPNELMFLSSAIKNISATTKTDIDVAMLRKRIREQTAQAAKEISTQAKKAGMSDSTVEEIRAKILGIGGA